MRDDLKREVILYTSRLRIKLSITEKIESNTRDILLSLKSGNQEKAENLLEENNHLISESCAEDYEIRIILDRICTILSVKDHYFLNNLSITGTFGPEIEKIIHDVSYKIESSRKMMNEIITIYENEKRNLKKSSEEISSLIKMNSLIKLPPE